LVDIVVADENLHVVFLFDQAVDRPDSQAARAIGICVDRLIPADKHNGC
jgi:hypothetical protein